MGMNGGPYCATAPQQQPAGPLTGAEGLALLLPQLAHGWHYGVHRVHNEANHCLAKPMKLALKRLQLASRV